MKTSPVDRSIRTEQPRTRASLRDRVRQRRRAVAAALTIALGLGSLTMVTTSPATAAAPFSCTADTVYMITSGGNVHQVAGDTGTTSGALYDGASSSGNQLGIKSGGVGAINTDNAARGGGSIKNYDRASTNQTSVPKQSGAGNIAGAVDPRSGIYYYGGYGSGWSSNVLTLYAYNPANGSTFGPVASITAPGAPGGNGDIAFDTLGRLYLVASSSNTSNLYVTSTSLPTASGQAAVTGSATQLSSSRVSAAVNGIAFASNGYLYLGSGSTIAKVDPTTGATVSTKTLTTGDSTDLGSCAVPTLVSVKIDFPRGRVSPTDQATVSLTRAGSAPVTGTTEGTEVGLQNQSPSEYVGPQLGFPGENYSAAVTGSGTIDLSKYTASWRCIVVETGAVLASGPGTTVSGTLPDSNGSTVECTVSLEAPPSGLTFTKTVSPTTITNPGELVTYTFTAVNSGGQILSNFQIADPLPGLSAIVCAPVALGGTLPIGATTTCSATYTSTIESVRNSTIDNTATATAAGNTPGDAVSVPSTATVDVQLVPPVATNDTATTTAQVPVTLPAVGNDSPGVDSDVALDPTATVLTNPAATDGGKRLVTAEGTWQVNADGTVTFTPAPGFSGETTPEPYRLTDQAGQTADATLTVTVRPGPVANANVASIQQGSPVTLSPLGNDTPGQNLDGSPASFAPGSLVFTDPAATDGGKRLVVPGEGTYVINADGTVTFTPEPTFTGTATPVEYQVTNSLGITATAPITISATPKPTANDDAASTPFNTPVTLPALLDDAPGAPGTPLVPASTVFPTIGQPAGATVSPDGKGLTVPGEGIWRINADGSVTFTPSAGYTGTTTAVAYQIADTNGTTATARLEVTVRSGPSATPDTATTAQNVNVTVSPLGNDTAGLNADGTPGSLDATSVRFPTTGQPAASTVSPDGLTLTVPGEGIYTINPTTGAVTFDPEPAFTGVTTPVAYTAQDSVLDATGATVHNPISSTFTVTVTGIRPIANDDSATTPFGTPVSLPAVGDDSAGDPTAPLVPGATRFPILGQPADAVVSADGKTLTLPGVGVFTLDPTTGVATFTPADDFAGTNPPVRYQIEDVNGTTAVAILQVTVQDGPEATADAASTLQNVNVTVTPLGNDTAGLNADGTPGELDETSVRFPTTGQPAGSTVGPDGLTLTVPGEGVYTIDPTTGVVTFDPDADFTGEATAVAYTAQDIVTDALGNTVNNPVSATITITVTGVQPLADDDSANTPFNTPVTLSGILDDLAGGASAPLVIASTIFPSGGQPVDAVISPDGTTLTVPDEGTWTINPNGSVTFTPVDGFTGAASTVTYEIADTNGTTDTATLDVTVQGGPDATADDAITAQDVTVTVSPLANDTAGLNADGTPGALDETLVRFPTTGQPAGSTVSPDGLTITVPGEGVYTIDPTTGVVTFDPEPTFAGDTTPVTYTAQDAVTDATGATVNNPISSTISIEVTAQPVATDDSANTPFNTPVTLPGLLNDAAGTPATPLDPASTVFPTDDQPAGAIISGNGKLLAVPGEGVWAINPDGSITFTPEDGFTGDTTPVTYEISDSDGTTDTATLEVTVQGGPDATQDAISTLQDVDVTISPLANDTAGLNADGTPGALDVTSVRFPTDGQPAGATVSPDGLTLTVPGEGVYSIDPTTGVVTFDPEPAFTGSATPVTYTAQDSVVDARGATVTNPISSIITISVTPQPVATDDSASTPFGTPVTLPGILDDLPGGAGAPLVPASTVFPTTGQPADAIISGDGKTLEVPGEGVWSINPTGSVTFTPAPGFVGDTTPVTYEIADTNGTTDTATLEVTVRSVPFATPDTAETLQDVTVTVSPLSNDEPGLNADGSSGELDETSVRFPTDGQPADSTVSPDGLTLTVPGEGVYTINPTTGVVTFDPEPAFTGAASPVTYTAQDIVTDSLGNTVNNPISSTITITVTPQPVANDDSATTPFNTPVTLPALLDDAPGAPSAPLVAASTVFPAAGQPADAIVSADGKTLTVPDEGVWTINPDGSITFTPDDGFVGDTTPVTYEIADTNGTTDTATLEVTVQGGPDGTDDTATTLQNVTVTVTPLTNDTAGRNADGTPGELDETSVRFPTDGQPAGSTVSPDGLILTVPGEGVYTIDPTTGVVTFDPDADFSGPATPVVYTAQDIVTETDGTVVNNPITSTIAITVTGIRPEANDDSATTPFGTPVTLPAVGDDSAGDPTAPLVPGATRFPILGQPADAVVSDGGRTLTLPGTGVFTLDPTTGEATFTPADGFAGTTPPVRYQIEDVNGTTDVATLQVTVQAGPEATEDTATTVQNVNVTVTPLGNDTAGDNADGTPGSLDVTSVRFPSDGQPAGSTVSPDGLTLTVPGEGVYTIDPTTGVVTFDPDADFSGEATPVTYTAQDIVTDALGTTVTNPISSTITITVTAVQPAANDDSATTAFGTPVTLPGLLDDAAGDPSAPLVPASTVFPAADQPAGAVISADGKTLTVAGEGIWSINPNGSVTFTPEPGFEGDATPVTYEIADTNGTTDTAQLTVTVQSGSLATPDDATTLQNVTVTVTPLSNDTAGVNADGTPGSLDVTSVRFTTTGQPASSTVDPDGLTLTVPGEGVYTIDPTTGVVTFDPDADFSGPATPVTYTAQDIVLDADGNTVNTPLTSTITITVTPVAPTATDDTATAVAGTTVTITGLLDDSAGDPSAPLVAASTVFPTDGQPAGAIISGNGKLLAVPGEGLWEINPDGSITFSPEDGFDGVTSPVTYEIADTNGTTDTATLTVTVQAGPEAAPDDATTLQNVTVTVSPLTNDTAGLNADGTPGTLDATSVRFPTAGQPAGSTVAADGLTLTVPGEGVYTIDPTTGVVTFDPDPDFSGETTPVSYSAEDEVVDSTGALVNNTISSTITITVTGIRPEANDDSATTPFGTPVTLPAVGDDSAGDPSAPLVPGATRFPILGQPADAVVSADGKTLTLPGVGVFTLDPTTGEATFTPADGFAGTTPPVRYQIEDTNGTTAVATLEVTVQAGPDATADTATTLQNVNVTVSPLGNDTPGVSADGFSGTLDVTSVRFPSTGQPAGSTVSPDGLTLTVPGEGVYTIDPTTGDVTFDPDADFSGPTTPVVYTAQDIVTDADGTVINNPLSSTIAVTVTAVTPTATADAAGTPFNTPVTLAGLLNDTEGDPSAPLVPASTVFPTDGQPAGAVISADGKTLTVADEGTWTINPDGSITFTPEPGFEGEATPVTYEIADTNGTTDTATLTVTVQVAPVATADTATTLQNVNVTVNPLANDTAGVNADGTPGELDEASVRFPTTGQPAGSTVSPDGLALTVPGEGIYTINPATGIVTFNPDADFTGPATPVTYTALSSVVDATGGTVTAPVSSTIAVTVVGVDPVAIDDTASTAFGTPVTVPGMLNDLPGDAGAALVPASTVFPAAGQPAGSTLSADGKTVAVPGEGEWTINPDGSITFTPEDGFAGEASPVTYEIADTNGTTDTAIVTVTVQAGPATERDAATVSQGASVILDPLANDTPGLNADGTDGSWTAGTLVFPATGQPAGAVRSADGKTLTVPGEGTYVIDANDRVIFTPSATFTGVAQPVAYEVTDSNGSTATSSIEITVTPVTPTADDDAASTVYGTPVTVTPLANDTAGLGDCSPKDASAPAPATCAVALDPTSVELLAAGLPAGSVVSADGKTATIPGEGEFTVDPTTGAVTFTPATGFRGPVTAITYTVLDANGTATTAQILVTVDAPGTVEPDVDTTDYQTPVTVDVLANDSPSTGATWDPTTLCLITDTGDCVTDFTRPGVGQWVVGLDGEVTFTPAKGYSGSAAIGYRVVDTAGVTFESTLTITVDLPTLSLPEPKPTALASTGLDVTGPALWALLALMLGGLLVMRARGGVRSASAGRHARR